MPTPRRASKQTAAPEEDLLQERLSPVTENYLLCLYKLWEESDVPTITQLADTLKMLPPTEGLGTSVPSVAGMVRRMQRQGLVQVGADKRIRLSGKGVEGGEDIVRRHRLAEWLVVRLMGMELHRAHIEAHRLEHGMSPEFQEKLMERLGYPDKSPYGRPIPGAGSPNPPADALTLDQATPGVGYEVDRIPEEDAELLRFLVEADIVPDHAIRLVEATPYLGVLVVSAGAENVSIGYNVARQIAVRPLPRV
ncbi:MAG: hypothetical protein BZY88_18500 [SAR202 cluster bacterium Io17-Chloro-G9]|nr:MAG: hypothetical protein BZY88_18500 [SAR202 cluster bacterium Io17-Chloro-G9]